MVIDMIDILQTLLTDLFNDLFTDWVENILKIFLLFLFSMLKSFLHFKKIYVANIRLTMF